MTTLASAFEIASSRGSSPPSGTRRRSKFDLALELRIARARTTKDVDLGVDVAFGDPILGEPDLVVARDAERAPSRYLRCG
jgi:hypothetical protein